MTDDLAVACGRDVPRETQLKLDHFEALLVQEATQQNLVSRHSIADAKRRHILDSAQLLRFAPGGTGPWLDIGSGGGLPGLVLAIIEQRPFTLAEPRKLRAEFLERCVRELGLDHVTVAPAKAERITGKFSAISARAVATLGDLFAMASHLSRPDTRWILPKGRSGAKELAEAQASWQGRFRLEPSVTADDATIVVAEAVQRRGNARGRG